MQSSGHSLWGWISHKTEEKKCGIFQIYGRDPVTNIQIDNTIDERKEN